MLFFRNAQNVVKLALGASTLSCTLHLLLHWFRYYGIYGFVIHVLKPIMCLESVAWGQNNSVHVWYNFQRKCIGIRLHFKKITFVSSNLCLSSLLCVLTFFVHSLACAGFVSTRSAGTQAAPFVRSAAALLEHVTSTTADSNFYSEVIINRDETWENYYYLTRFYSKSFSLFSVWAKASKTCHWSLFVGSKACCRSVHPSVWKGKSKTGLHRQIFTRRSCLSLFQKDWPCSR